MSYYKDPTANSAIGRIMSETRQKDIPKIYLASPFKGNSETTEQENIDNAVKYSRFVATQMNAIPFAPHLLFTRFLNDTNPKERKLGQLCSGKLMHLFDEMWVFGTYISIGMKYEIAHWESVQLGAINAISAWERGELANPTRPRPPKPLRYFDEECNEITNKVRKDRSILRYEEVAYFG